MNIKSNKKKKGPGLFKSAYLGFLELMPQQTLALKIMVVLGGIIVGYFTWNYSGMIALFFVVTSFIIIIQDRYDTITPMSKLIFTFIAALLVLLMGTNNIYHITEKKIEVKYSKLVFTDSTEKMIIFMTSPEKRTITQPLSTSEYYTLKDQESNITMFISEKGAFSHWAMLYAKDANNTNAEVDEYSYSFTIKLPSEEIVNDNWKESNDRKFVRDITLTKEPK